MHITMVKKRLADGSECRKCQEASAYLESRGLWGKIDDVVWAQEGDATSAGMQLGAKLRIEQAPFFVVHDGGTESAYASVLQLIHDRLGVSVSTSQRAGAIDAEDIGGI